MRNFEEILREIVKATNHMWYSGCDDRTAMIECATRIYIEEMKLEVMKVGADNG